jgi:hypothetical protein
MAGKLTAESKCTEKGGPGFGYSIDVLDRTGIKSYQGKPLERTIKLLARTPWPIDRTQSWPTLQSARQVNAVVRRRKTLQIVTHNSLARSSLR